MAIKKKDDETKGKKGSMTSKPIQLSEVKVTASRYKPKPDSVNVGYAGKYTKMSTGDLKSMVKKGNLKSIDTSSVKSMSKTTYGSTDMKKVADSYLAKKKRDASMLAKNK